MPAAPLFIGQPWVDRLGWTLVHFLWQGTVIAAVYALLRQTPGRAANPETRYRLACAALAAMFVAPFVTFILPGSPATVSPIARIALLPHGVPSSGTGTILLESLPPNSSELRGAALDWVVVLWLAGAILFCFRLTGSWILAARLRSTLVRPAPPAWQQTLARLAAQIDLTRPVRLLVSARVHAPAVVGWLRPIVLVPVGVLAGLPAAQMEALLIHELAHIRRHDWLVNVLQSVAEALLFYHPAVWWVSRHIRTEREMCCDDVAASVTGDVLTYASALAELESWRPAHAHSALAANGGSLSHRIARLLGQPHRESPAGVAAAAVFTAILLTIGAYGAFAQSDSSLRFEVASVKLNTDTGRRIIRVLPRPGGVLVTENATVRLLIQNAYTLQPFQISGGPGWMQSDGYNIDAKGTPTATRAQVFLMLRSLLEDRFQLEFHRETKELPVYALVLAKSGPKLSTPKDGNCIPVDPNGAAPPPSPPPGPSSVRPCGGAIIMLESSKARIQGAKVPMGELTRVLAMAMGRPVIDRTGFTDAFDFTLDFTPDESVSGLPRAMGAAEPGTLPVAADPTGPPPILVAIQEQLGLKLDSTRGPVEIMVVDRLQRPSAN